MNDVEIRENFDHAVVELLSVTPFIRILAVK